MVKQIKCDGKREGKDGTGKLHQLALRRNQLNEQTNIYKIDINQPSPGTPPMFPFRLSVQRSNKVANMSTLVASHVKQTAFLSVPTKAARTKMHI